jgi:hypothetical protein
MKRRFLGFFVALCVFLNLCLTVTPIPIFAIDGSPEVQWGVAAENGGEPTVWVGNGSMAEAVAYADGLSGGSAYIQLLSDIDTDTITFARGNTILDLNGKKLTDSSSSEIIKLTGGILTIDDGSIGKKGNVTSKLGSVNKSIISVDDGELIINNGAISNNRNSNKSHTIYVTSGNVIINGGMVEQKSDAQNFVIYNKSYGTIRLQGGVVKSYKSRGIFNDGNLIIDGGEVYSKNVLIDSYGTITMNKGRLKGDSTYPGIYNSGNLTIIDGEIGAGNAIVCMDNGSLNVKGGKIVTKYYAIDSQGKGKINVTGGLLQCTTEDIGAIRHIGSGEFTIGGSAIVTANVSKSSEGTIFVADFAKLEINGGTIENTSSNTNSNAICVGSGSVSIKSKLPITIKSKGKAMNIAPNLFDTIVKKAATNADGTSGVEPYNPNNIINYKYPPVLR